MRYLHAYLAIAICVVQAKAALQIVPGLPFPVAAQGMRWIGSVTPGGRNVTLYGTLDEVDAQIDEMKLRPEEEWPFSTEIEEMSILPNIAPRADGLFKRVRSGIDCNNARGDTFVIYAFDIIRAIVEHDGSCGSPAAASHPLLL
ncbi:hypothetical protein BKA61DRAFT_662091 [Leptodontidium sp. MPI-SDFR-AT-0119]|nr:hypothetical protein BKA61DRAFT_662091 [Leptodontidium sp. MPI-SDFR-AT-0119]